jgi:hypothetical protein
VTSRPRTCVCISPKSELSLDLKAPRLPLSHSGINQSVNPWWSVVCRMLMLLHNDRLV